MYSQLNDFYYSGANPLSFNPQTIQGEPKEQKVTQSASKPIQNSGKSWKYAAQYQAVNFNDLSAGGTKKSIFKENLIVPTHNRGQKKDMEAFSAKKSTWGNEQALRHGCKIRQIKPGEKTELNPYWGGNCFGGAVTLAKRWLNTPDQSKNLAQAKTLSKDFEAGVPKEGVITQGVYERLHNANKGKKGLLDAQTKLDVQVVATSSAGLSIPNYPVQNGSPKETLDFVKECPPGAYLLVFPTYSSTGSQVGLHDLAFIKIDDQTSVLYDPNYGIGYNDTGRPEELVQRAAEVYVGPLDKPTTTGAKVSSAFRRIGHFFTGEANAPLFGEIKSGFDVFQLAS